MDSSRLTLLHLLRTFSWQELTRHRWRNAAAIVSVALGVALALSVHLINASALDEFAQAARTMGGSPDVEVRSLRVDGAFSEDLYTALARDADVAVASPVLEVSAYGVPQDDTAASRRLLKIVGVDALQVAAIAPDLLPLPQGQRLDIFAPDAVFLNAAASAAFPGAALTLQWGPQRVTLRMAGTVRAAGPPLAVMDIAAVQDMFDKQGVISRVDVRLQAGVDRAQWMQAQAQQAGRDHNASFSAPGPALERIDHLSRAYRVNLTVLALVALFTGAFLVFSVMALSVARRGPQWALLGVLGLTAAQRQRLVLMEAAALGTLGSAAGVVLGTALAGAALRWLGGDLGGGFFGSTTPALRWSGAASGVFGMLGVLAALAGAWWPARQAGQLPLAATLKGLGTAGTRVHRAGPGAALLAVAAVLALLPPVAGVALAAYTSVALLLMGGIVLLPWLVGVVLGAVAPLARSRLLPLLALERAARVRESAAVAVSGVVAALSLAVALTVMVASFRASVMQWLDTMLPAPLYLRTAASASATDTAFVDSRFVAGAATVPGVARLTSQRTLPVSLDAARPPVALLARPLHDPQTGALSLALLSPALPVPPGHIGIYVSEAMVDLYGATPGRVFTRLDASFNPPKSRGAERFAQVKEEPAKRAGDTEQNAQPPELLAPTNKAQPATFFVAGVWRDYARQFGTIAMDRADYVRLTGDTRVNDMAFWLNPQADIAEVKAALRALPGGELVEFGEAGEIRAASLRVFDRSFAVTYWLQAVAIGIGLFGVAASFSAQVLARRKEFGLLAHLGLTRRQVLRLVALEGAAWTTLGTVAGTVLGLLVAAVLVFVVNPQSFHWTMDLHLPLGHLSLLALAVITAGTLTARLAGQAAASRDAVAAVREDW